MADAESAGSLAVVGGAAITEDAAHSRTSALRRVGMRETLHILRRECSRHASAENRATATAPSVTAPEVSPVRGRRSGKFSRSGLAEAGSVADNRRL